MKSKLYFGIIFLSLFFSVYEPTNAQSPDWLWAKAMSATYGVFGNSIAIDPAGSGEVYTTGGFEGTVDFDPGAETFNLSSAGGVDIFISKLDGSGNFVWVKAMGGTDAAAFAESIAIDPTGSGAIYTTGHFMGTIDFDPGVGIHHLTSASVGCPGWPFCSDIFISKLDSSGNFVWAKVIGGSEDDFGSSIAIDPGGSGDVYTTGPFRGTVDFDPGKGTFNLISAGNHDIFISKLDGSGNFVWAKVMGGSENDFGSSIAVDPGGSGDIYTTGPFWGTVDFDPGKGTFNLTSAGNQDIFISKLDGSGNFVWAKSIGGNGTDHGHSIAVDPGSGHVYTTGSFSGTVDFDPGVGTFNLISAGELDIFISKIDRLGNFAWAKAMGGKSYDEVNFIAVDPGGSEDVYTTGWFLGTADFNPGADSFNLTAAGKQDIFISKLDGSGNFVWAKAMSGTGNDFGLSIALDALGHMHVTGFFESPSLSFDSISLTNAFTPGSTFDAFIAKLDTTFTVPVVEIKTHQITIYPNPTTSKLTIDFNEEDFFDIDITLFNILGEVVLSSTDENIVHEKTIDLSQLAAGIYFIELNFDGNRVMEKVVKD